MIRHSQQQIGFMEALDVALDRLLHGADIDECLSLYPYLADDLEPLLRVAGMVRAEVMQPLPPEMERWLATGAQEFAAITDQMLARRHGRRKLLKPLRKAAVQRVLVGALVVAVLLASVDTASAQSLPGDPLYGWKVAREDLTLSMTADPVQRSKLHITYARRRLTEIDELLASNAVIDSQTLREPLTLLSDHTRGAVSESRDVEVVDVLVDVATLLDEVQTALSQLSSKVPDAAPLLENVQEQIDAAIEPTASPTARATASPVPSLPLTTPVEAPATGDVTNSETVPQTEHEPEQVNAATPIATPPPTARPPRPTPTPGQIAPTASSAPAPTATPMPRSPTVTPTSSPTMTPTALPTDAPPTDTPLPTNTPSPTFTPPPTATRVPPTEPSFASSTPQPPPTARPPRPTSTPRPTMTPTPVPTATPTETLAPTATPTETPSPAPSVTPTEDVEQPTETPSGSEASGMLTATPDDSGANRVDP